MSSTGLAPQEVTADERGPRRTADQTAERDERLGRAPAQASQARGQDAVRQKDPPLAAQGAAAVEYPLRGPYSQDRTWKAR